MAEKDSPKKESKYAGLMKCFSALVNKKQVNLDIVGIEVLLKTELGIGIDVNNDALKAILPYMFIFYIKSWPGWQRSKEHFSGKLTLKDWFEKFRQFIVVKMNFLIKNGYKQALDMLEEGKRKDQELKDKSKFSNQAVQADINNATSSAPYTINITCPPMLMTSLLFSQSGENIILTRHTTLPWINLSYKQLINSPHVSVEFETPDFHFKRKNCGEFHRYLNLSNQVSLPAQDFIDSIDMVDKNKSRVCFSSKVLTAYATQYIKVFNKIMPIPAENLTTLFGELIDDINDLPMKNTIATNTVVVFNIGKGSFFRKKMSSEKTQEATSVKLNEIFIPKMETTLFVFKDVQDLSTPSTTFKGLNAVNPNGRTWPGKVTYRCEYCELSFDTSQDMQSHLYSAHGREGNFRCFKCDQELTVAHLSEVRWKHHCYNK